MSALNSVCIFCGASPGGDVAYRAAAEAMGRAIVARGLRLVYGGAKVGLMGAVAERSSVRAAFGIVVIAGLAACLLAWRYRPRH